MKPIAVLVLALLLALLYCCCAKRRPEAKPSSPQPPFVRCQTGEQLWASVKDKQIISFVWCDEDPDEDPETWHVLYRYRPEDWQPYAELFLDPTQPESLPTDAFPELAGPFPRQTCTGVLKVITDKGTYVGPLMGRYHPMEGDWRERASLAGLWPCLDKQDIQRITFCEENPWTSIDSWPGMDVPQERLAECIALLDAAAQNADPNAPTCIPGPDRMKIITSKAKYLLSANESLRNRFTQQ
ncbi:MAG TPA: hypothetical protein ENN81_00855 [Phycisphaerales bacterium]|nr:hypothetical protein [Phycisphaerales bacterium]